MYICEMPKPREEDAYSDSLSQCPRGVLATGAKKVLDEIQGGAYKLKPNCAERIHSPKNIVVSGDSAGGNLTIALLRYISEYGSEINLPTPSAAVLWSPWIDPSDISGSYVHDNINYKTDYLSPTFTHWGTHAYAGLPGVQTLSQPYISQKNKPFKCDVPTWVNVGGSEILYFDVVEWAQKMKEAGNDVELDIDENLPHDVLAVGNILGFNKEAVGMAKRAGEWLKAHGK